METGEYEAPRIHPDTPTGSHGFGNLEITISFINNFLTIFPTRLRFSVLLDHNTAMDSPWLTLPKALVDKNTIE